MESEAADEHPSRIAATPPDVPSRAMNLLEAWRARYEELERAIAREESMSKEAAEPATAAEHIRTLERLRDDLQFHQVGGPDLMSEDIQKRRPAQSRAASALLADVRRRER